MAISTGTVWEVRTTGSDTNGGGYSSGGTDYSQQDAAQLSLTDCATASAGSTTLTSSTGGFTSAMVGNMINLSAGTNLTTGIYEITGYTDTNTVTLDSAPGSGGGVSGATGKVGGALASPGMAFGSATTANKIWLKSGTYTLTTSTANVSGGLCHFTTTNDGSGSSAISKFEGYDTTRGDRGTKPVIQVPSTGSYSVNVVLSQRSYCTTRNIAVDGNNNGSASLTGFLLSTSYDAHDSLDAYNLTIGFDLASGNSSYFFNLYAYDCGTGVDVSGSRLFYCRATGCTGDGFVVSASSCLIGCEASNNNSGFAENSVGAMFVNCSSANNTTYGFETTSIQDTTYINCVAYGNGTENYKNNTNANLVNLINCAGPSSAYTASDLDSANIWDFVTLTADPFTDAANDDLTLNDTAGGGAALKQAGFGTANWTIGAAQAAAGGGGGTDYIISQGVHPIGSQVTA